MQRECIIRMMHFQWLCSPAISMNQFKRKLHTVQTNVRFQNIVGRLDYDGKHRCAKIDVPCWRSCLGSWMLWWKTFKARLIPCTHEFTSHVEAFRVLSAFLKVHTTTIAGAGIRLNAGEIWCFTALCSLLIPRIGRPNPFSRASPRSMIFLLIYRKTFLPLVSIAFLTRLPFHPPSPLLSSHCGCLCVLAGSITRGYPSP